MDSTTLKRSPVLNLFSNSKQRRPSIATSSGVNLDKLVKTTSNLANGVLSRLSFWNYSLNFSLAVVVKNLSWKALTKAFQP